MCPCVSFSFSNPAETCELALVDDLCATRQCMCSFVLLSLFVALCFLCCGFAFLTFGCVFCLVDLCFSIDKS